MKHSLLYLYQSDYISSFADLHSRKAGNIFQHLTRKLIYEYSGPEFQEQHLINLKGSKVTLSRDVI